MEQQFLIEIDENFNVTYYNSNNQIHRVGGPAVIRRNGQQLYFDNGNLHRDDGPAVIGPGNMLQWFLHGRELSASKYMEGYFKRITKPRTKKKK